MEKRSLSIHGHRTSLSLETEFWKVLDSEVTKSGKSFASFISELDDKRSSTEVKQNLASYLRVWLLMSRR